MIKCNRKNVGIWICSVILLLGVVVLFANVFVQIQSKRTIGMFLVVFCLICMVIAYVTYITLKEKNNYVSTFVVLVALWGLIYTIVFPPNTGVDENAHWGNALYDSYTFYAPEIEGRFPGRVENIVNLDFDVQRAPSLELYEYRANGNWFGGDSTWVEDIGWWKFGALNKYYPTAIGVALGRVMNLGNSGLMYFGRLFNIVFYGLLVGVALWIVPYGKPTILAFSLIPMMSYIYGSYSYDTLLNAYIILYIALCIRIHEESNPKWYEYLGAVVLYVLTIPFKGIYIWLGLFGGWIIVKKIKQTFVNKKNLFLCVISTSLIVLIILFLERDYIERYICYIISPISYAASTGEESYTMVWIIQHIPSTIAIIGKSMVEQFGSFVYQAFVGMCYGHLLPTVIVVVYVGVLLSICVFQREKVFSSRCRLFGWFLAGGIYLTAYIGQMINETPMGSDVVQGLWGRYFLPLIFFLLMMYCGKRYDRQTIGKLLYFENIVGVISICIIIAGAIGIL